MLRDKLKTDSITALKNHNSRRVEVIRFLISLIDKKELQLPPGSMDDKEMMNVLRKELKNKEESREIFLKAGRNDLVQEQDEEIAILKEYLPEELGEDRIGQIVDEVLQSRTGGNINFGLVMGEVMKKTNGMARGDVVSKLVKERLDKRS